MPSSFEDIHQRIQQFSEEREWTQFHSSKNLVLALVSEVGELAEIIQWKSDSELIDYLQTKTGKQRLSEEIADIAIYIIRICQQQNINLMEIIENKLEINAQKYPISKSKGSAAKYTEL